MWLDASQRFNGHELGRTLREIRDREARLAAAVPGVSKSQTDSTTDNNSNKWPIHINVWQKRNPVL